MPEITAEQLATVAKIHRFCIEMGHYERFSVDLPLADWDHIIACVREHEELNPPPYWTHMEDGGYFYYDSTNRLAALVLNRDGVWQSWVAGKCIATDESLDAAKAAVEKAARNG